MTDVVSIVIVDHNGRGYSASLRFTDSTKDLELACENKEILYSMIAFRVRKATR